MIDLDELQRLAEGASQRLPGEEWFNRHELRGILMAHEQDALLIEAMSPDTAKKLIAAVRAVEEAHAQIQSFKTRWMALPPFAEKLNRSTREGMTIAHMPIMRAEEALRSALEELN